MHNDFARAAIPFNIPPLFPQSGGWDQMNRRACHHLVVNRDMPALEKAHRAHLNKIQ